MMKKVAKQWLPLLLAALLLLVIAPVAADGSVIVGEVTVIAKTSVNVRSGGSTDYPVIATAKPGELFQTTGQVSSGWYEILLPDNVFGYISNNLVYYYAYPNPIPIGNPQFTITVQYMAVGGQSLKTVQVPVKVGQNLITADDSQVPGYRLTSTRSVYVTVDARGNAIPSGVIFNYEPLYLQPTVPPATTWYLPVYYRDNYNQIVASEYRQVRQGTQLINADSGKLPQGYYLTGTTDAVVSVGYDGTLSPRMVEFKVLREATPTATPVTYLTVPVSYRDEAGNVLHNATQPVREGYTTVTANDSLVPAGYTLTSSRSVVVYSSSQGVTFPSTVVFTYRAAVSATIQVVYRDASNNSSLYTETRPLGQGSFTISADDTKVPAGYVLQGSRSVQVTVYSNGTVSQNQVVFNYARPVSAQISVLYRNTSGQTLFSEFRQLSQGTTTITADDSKVPAGYILQGTRNVQVTVYSNGTVSQNQIVFTYAQPASALLYIEYRDSNGVTLYNEQKTLAQGTTTITANDSRVPDGYILQSNRNVQVTVYANGSLSQDRVVFLYAKPATAEVRIVYKDNTGAILFSTTQTVNQGTTTYTANDYRAPTGYVLLSARNIQVTVYADGTINPSQVEFTYGPPAPPVTVNVPIIYKGHDGTIFFQGSFAVSSAEPKSTSANASRVPAGYILTSPSTVRVTVSANGTPTPKKVVFVYRDPSTITEAQILPAEMKHSYKGNSVPVYSGPGTQYYRANNGKANLGSGSIKIWGQEGDWVLIGYGLSNNLYRVGYIQRSALPADLAIPALILGSQSATIVSDASLTDDPIINPTWLTKIPKGTKVTLLAYENFANHWAYIETTFEGKPIRGFINKVRVQAD